MSILEGSIAKGTDKVSLLAAMNREIAENRQTINDLFKPEGFALLHLSEHYNTLLEESFLTDFRINKNSLLALMKSDLQTDTLKRKLLINSAEPLIYSFSNAAKHYQFSDEEKKSLLESIKSITDSAVTLDDYLEKNRKVKGAAR